MILNSPYISGSLTVTGNIITSGSITISGSIASASYASNAELLDGLDATVFTLTSSFIAQTASFTAFTASLNAFSASQNSFTASILAQTASLNAFSASILSYTASQNILNGTYTLTSSFNAQTASFTAFTASILAQTASLNAFSASVLTFTGSASTRLGALESYTSSLNDKTSSFATTGSNIFIGNQTITGSVLQSGSFTSTGTLTAQTLVVQTITSSVVYSSGSNIFGNAIANTQTFTGSVNITGSLSLNSITIPTSASLASTYLQLAGGTLTGDLSIAYTTSNLRLFLNNTTATTGRSWYFNSYSNGNLYIGNTTAGDIFNFSSAGAATFSSTITGTTIYGSTAVCSPVGKFTSCIDAGSGTFSSSVTANNLYLTSSGGIFLNAGLTLFPYASHTYIRPYAASGNINFQNQAGNLLVTMLDGGNIGINCSAPSGKLQVANSSTQYALYTSTGNLELYTPEGNCGYVRLGSAYNLNGVYGSCGLNYITSGISSHAFYTTDNACERMRITSGGNVGIGTSVAPAVNGLGLAIYASDYPRITLRNSTSGDTTGDGLQIAMVGANVQYDLAESGYQMWTTGGTERMRITSTGIACFACQVCVGGMVVLNNTSFGGPATEAAFRIRMADNGGINNDPGIGLDGAGSGSERMWFNALSGHYFNNGTNGIKLNIDSAGIACFACQVCAPSGVKFGSGATTLNYYEEGTWTPRLKNGSFTTNAGASNAGWYTRIGNLVTVGGTLDWGAGSGAQDGNSLQIACLPFASSSTSNQRNVGQFGAPAASSIGFKCTTKGQFVLVNDPGASYIYLIETFQDGTYSTYSHNLCVANAGTLYGFQITYHTL